MNSDGEATLGELAYSAYFESCGGRSVRGDKLPLWPEQSPVIQAHWEAAARQVATTIAYRIDCAFGRLT